MVGFYQFANPGFREICEPQDFVEWVTFLTEFQREEFGLEEDDRIEFRVSRTIVEGEEGNGGVSMRTGALSESNPGKA